MFAGAFMMGAKDRLLPPSVPYRFFATAVVLHFAGWAALLAGAEDVPGFQGGLGPALAGLHLMTLGVLAMTAIGAAFQLLPVATRRQLGPVWACRLTWWLYAPGVAVLGLGMATAAPWALHAGAALTVAGLALFGVLVARNLLQVTDLPSVTLHVWLALASLAALAGLGVALVVDIDAGFLGHRASAAAAHAVLGGYGFMGMLAMGFSYVLVPMFVLAQPVPDRVGRTTAAVSLLALGLGAGGALAGQGVVAALGGLAGLVAVGLHVKGLMEVLKTRMRRKLEPFFRLVKAAWALLPASVLAGVALALGAPSELVAPLWGFLLVFGWLLSFVTGVLQRIMPFLASMHSGADGRKPALLSQLTASRPLAIHAACHGAAVVLITAGLMAPSPLAVAAGAGLGLAGATAFAAFAVELMRRYRNHQRTHPPQDNGELARC
ncbi:MAG: hypothetical protein AB1918_19085 [Pseudomonadota bacterium]